jgi:hypothetical protein
MTVLAWLSLTRHPDYDTNWTIINCERYNEGGFLLRVDGNSGKFFSARTRQEATRLPGPSPACSISASTTSPSPEKASKSTST